MRFEIRKAGSTKLWDITAVNAKGKLRGQHVATVEGVTLKHAQFFDDVVAGEIEAIWGAQIEERVYEDLDIVSALRFNHAFHIHGSVNGGAVRALVPEDGCWIDSLTGETVYRARRAVLLGELVRVSLK